MYEPNRYRTASKEFEHHEAENVEYVGATGGGAPLYFDPSEEAFFEGEYDVKTDAVVDRPETERELEPRETVGEALESLGDDLDWDSLSEFAREHVRTDEER